MRRCQIMVQFECGKKSFFKCKKKEILIHKINTKWYCWMYEARILQKNSPDHLFQVIRWSGAVLTFCSPKKLLFLQKSLFLDGAHTQIYNLFMKKNLNIASQHWHSHIVGSLNPLCLLCALPMTHCEVMDGSHSRSVTKILTAYWSKKTYFWRGARKTEMHSFPTMYIMGGCSFGGNGSK